MSDLPRPLRPNVVNRSKNCHCCGERRVRELRRIGTPHDPDYAVAVCPTCDVARDLFKVVPDDGA